MDLTPIITRLQAEAADVFRLIGAAAEYDAAADALTAAPAVFVIEEGNLAAPAGLVGSTRQAVTVRVACVLAVKLQRDARGQGGRPALQVARGAVRAALLGWAPDESTGRRMEYAGGQMLDFLPGTIWWQDIYTVVEYISAER